MICIRHTIQITPNIEDFTYGLVYERPNATQRLNRFISSIAQKSIVIVCRPLSAVRWL
jgi:hypothetical protein